MRLFCWSRAVVFSMARAPGCGLAALCLVSRRSVWYRGALLRGLSQCRCGCELVSPCESLASRVPVVPLPLCSKHRGTTVSPSSTLLLVWGVGWLHLQRRQNHLLSAAPPARIAALRTPPSSAFPEDSSHGCVTGLIRGKILFKIFYKRIIIIIMIIIWLVSL